MQIPAITVEIAIIATLVLGGLVGAVAGRHRLRMIVMSTYIGIVLAGQLAAPAAKMAHVSFNIAAWAVLAAPILIFGLLGTVSGGGKTGKGGRKQQSDKGPAVLNLLVGTAAGALIIASAFQILPPREQSVIYGNSFLASELSAYYPWLVCLLPAAVLIQGFFKRKTD